MSRAPIGRDETYLGDGLYCSFDGFQIRLRAPRENDDHVVFLEPAVYNALVKYVADLRSNTIDGDAHHD
jgi:hypothetical protein